MTRIIEIIELISDWAARLSAVILGAMTLLILLEIFLWNFFKKTTLVADEYSAYGLAIIIFAGAGYCLKERGHIRITLILSLMPQRLARIVTFISTSATTIFFGYLLCFLFKMLSSTWRYNSTSGTLTNTPLWIPQGLMLLGAVVFFLQFIGISIKTFRAIKTGEEVV